MEDRLNALKDKLGVQWNELAQLIGISVPMLGFLRRGERNPSPKVLLSIKTLEDTDCSTTTKSEVQHWKARAQAAEARAAVAEEKLKLVNEALSFILQGAAKLKEAVK